MVELPSGITVSVARMGQVFKDYALPQGATVQDALDAAHIGLESGDTVAVNGTDVNTNKRLTDKDRVFVVPAAEGGL